MSGERRNDDSPTGWSRWDPELGRDVWIGAPRHPAPAPVEMSDYDRTYGMGGSQPSPHVRVVQPPPPPKTDLERLADLIRRPS